MVSPSFSGGCRRGTFKKFSSNRTHDFFDSLTKNTNTSENPHLNKNRRYPIRSLKNTDHKSAVLSGKTSVAALLDFKDSDTNRPARYLTTPQRRCNDAYGVLVIQNFIV